MIEQLQGQMGERCSVNPYILAAHGRDENATPGQLPLAVVFAETVADVQATLAWARAAQTPVIAFGAGTSFEGHIVPQAPAISLDLSRMNHVLRITPEDFTVTVEPGVTRHQLNAALRHVGLFFPVDPGADATLGGMAATNASGTTTVRYGGMHQNVLALEAVLANGDLVQLGRAVRKSSSGYDLRDLFIGSGGTLGIITQLTLRLHPIPDVTHTVRAVFPTVAAAAEAAYQVMAQALPVARLELLDDRSIATLNRGLGRNDPEQPTLLMEFHSSTPAALAAEVTLMADIVNGCGAVQVAQAQTKDEQARLWEIRHKAYWTFVSQYPGCRYTITDVAVPLAQLVDAVQFAHDLLDELGLKGCLLGHVGDGNFHTFLATSPAEAEQAHVYATRLVTYALGVGGTASGEHGIGVVKRPFLAAEHGLSLTWMRQIKDLFDPQHLLNPGKDV
ncbi:MAG: FAD-binding oxidoreductase [Ktedonobacterales bacterium]|nr:FAD-binding oxidoreductase [Ktedonobacterales bacterium]